VFWVECAPTTGGDGGGGNGRGGNGGGGGTVGGGTGGGVRGTTGGPGGTTTLPNTAFAQAPQPAQPPVTLLLAVLGTGVLIAVGRRLQRPVTVRRYRDFGD
jgi:hypothetical protein